MSDTIVITRPKLFEGQEKAYEMHRNNRYFVLCCGRRWGKDYFLVRVIIDAILEGKKIGLWSPLYEMGVSVFRQVLFYTFPLLKLKDSKLCKADFITGAHFKAWHTKDNKNGRGQKYHLALINECAFCDSSFYDEIWQDTIKPTLSTKGEEGKAIFASTPFGFNHFKKMADMPKENKKWAYLHYPTSESPYVSQEEIDENEADLPAEIFARNFLAQFVGSNKYQLFPLEIFDNLKKIQHIKEEFMQHNLCYVGIDFCGEGEESRDFNSFCIRVGNSFTDYQMNKNTLQDHCFLIWERMQKYLAQGYFVYFVVDAVGVGNASLAEFRKIINDSQYEKHCHVEAYKNKLVYKEHKNLYYDRTSYLLYKFANSIKKNLVNIPKLGKYKILLEQCQSIEYHVESKGQENVIRVYKKGFDKKAKSPDIMDAMKYTLTERFLNGLERLI